MTLSPELQELLRNATPLFNTYPDFAVAGGVAPLIYTFDDRWQEAPNMAPVGTLDVDIICPYPAAVAQNTAYNILRQAGFTQGPGRSIREGEASPDRFRLKEGSEEYIEFVTSSEGRHNKKDGRAQTDMHAHAVPYIEMLLKNTIRIDVPDVGEIPVPHPTRYVIQKTVIHKSRSPRQAMKDQADVLSVLAGYRRAHDSLADHWRAMKAKGRPEETWIRKVITRWQNLYVYSTRGAEQVANIYSERASRTVAPEAIQRAFRVFLKSVGES